MSKLESKIKDIVYMYASEELQMKELELEIKRLCLHYFIYSNTKLGIFEEPKENEVYDPSEYLKLFDKFIDEYYE